MKEIESVIYDENLYIKETTKEIILDKDENIIGYKISATLYTKEFLIKINDDLLKDRETKEVEE